MTQGVRSYQSKRRKRGAQPGNLNAEGVQKHIEIALANEELATEAAEANGLEAEILMLRTAVRDLNKARKQVQTLQEMIKITQMMSLAGERLANMLMVHKKLGGEVSYFQKIVAEALEEFWAEKGRNNSTNQELPDKGESQH